MKTIVISFALIAIIAIVAIRLKSNKTQSHQRVYHYNSEAAINVQADTLMLQNIDNYFTFTGTFEACKETKISAELQGKINTVYVDVGYKVKKEQPIIQLDNSLLKLQLQAAEVQIEGLDADVKRYTVLAGADAIQGVQLEKSVIGLKSAEIQKNTLLEQINKTIIKAPFDGIVTAKLSEEGAFAAPGIPLVQITDISTLKFTVNVPESDLNLFNANQIYTVVADIYADIALVGKATLIGSKGNNANSFPIQITVKNTNDFKIKAGMFGKVILKEGKTDKCIVILASSIVGSTVKPQVYLIKNGKATLQTISVSKRIANKVIVNKGLIEGDVIVTGGLINLYDSANVAINTKGIK